MNHQILSVHIDNIDQSKQPLVTVAVDRGHGYWKAFQSNHSYVAGHPIHKTNNLSEQLFNDVAAYGIEVQKKEAVKLFPNLAAANYEN